MPSVFTDEIAGADFTILDDSDWTVNSAVLPNGDNAVNGDGTINPTYTVIGTDLDFRTGDWTVEFWLWTSGITDPFQVLFACGKPGDSTKTRWQSFLNSAEGIVFGLYNTSGNPQSIQTTGTVSTSTWHHVVCTKPNGAAPLIYIDTVASGGVTSGSGTAVTPAATDRIYLGTGVTSTEDIGAAIRIAKLAIYDRILTAGEISAHYTAMTA